MPPSPLPPASDTVQSHLPADSGTPPPATETTYLGSYVADVYEKAQNQRRLRDADNASQEVADEDKTSDELQVDVWALLDLFNPGSDSDDKAEDSSVDHEPDDEEKSSLTDPKLPKPAPEPAGVPRESEKSHETSQEEKPTMETPCDQEPVGTSADEAQAPKKSAPPCLSLSEDEHDAVIPQQHGHLPPDPQSGHVALVNVLGTAPTSNQGNDPNPKKAQSVVLKPAYRSPFAPIFSNSTMAIWYDSTGNQVDAKSNEQARTNRRGFGYDNKGTSISHYLLKWAGPDGETTHQRYAPVALFNNYTTFFAKRPSDTQSLDIPAHVDVTAYDSLNKWIHHRGQVAWYERREYQRNKQALESFCTAAAYFDIKSALSGGLEDMDYHHGGVVSNEYLGTVGENFSVTSPLVKYVAAAFLKQVGSQEATWKQHLPLAGLSGMAHDHILAVLKSLMSNGGERLRTYCRSRHFHNRPCEHGFCEISGGMMRRWDQ